jgi:hypothetical protein
MSVYEKIKLDLARRNLEMEQELEKRRLNFDAIFSKIVPRLENYFNKECDSLIRDGGRANVASELESPVRSITTFTFALPYDGLHAATPSHTYRVIVQADRLCVAEGRVSRELPDPSEKPAEKPQAAGAAAESKPADKPAIRDELGSVDAPDFLIKLDKSLAKMLELVMGT